MNILKKILVGIFSFLFIALGIIAGPLAFIGIVLGVLKLCSVIALSWWIIGSCLAPLAFTTLACAIGIGAVAATGEE